MDDKSDLIQNKIKSLLILFFLKEQNEKNNEVNNVIIFISFLIKISSFEEWEWE